MNIMSREFCYSLGISYQTFQNWKAEGMTIERSENNYIFLTKETFRWVVENKPKYAEKATLKMEAEDGK